MPVAKSVQLAEQLYDASYQGKDTEVLRLLKHGANPNHKHFRNEPYHRATPLHMACLQNHPLTAQHLIQWGAQIEATNVRGETPLHNACLKNSQACVELLLGHHCRTDTKNVDRLTPGDIARLIGYTSLADYVPNYKAPPRGPLSSFPSVKQLDQLNIDEWDKLGCQLGVPEAQLESFKDEDDPILATLIAAKIKNPDMRWQQVVSGLLSIGECGWAAGVCDVEALDGHSPLSVAVYYGWLDLLKFLVDKVGRNPKEPINEAGDTLLSLACTMGQIGVIDYLLKSKTFELNEPVNAAGNTLRSLAEAQGLSEVTKYVENFNADSADHSELKQKYVARLNELIEKRSKTTNLKYLKVYFIGSAGNGKSTTRKRLTGSIVNLSKLKPEERKRCSTYLAECTQVLAVVDDSEAKLVLQASDNLEEEVQLLFSYLYGNRAAEAHNSAETSDDPVPKATKQSDNEHEADKIPDPQHACAHQETQDEHTQQEKRATDESEEAKQKSPTTHTKVDVEQVIAGLRSIVGSGKYAEELLGKILLNLVDVGGQPGFLEMLPFLSKGPGLFLSFFPLDKDLDEQCEVSYEREDDKITPYKSTYSNRETLSKILSSVSYHTSFDDKELAEKMGKFGDVQPVATLVGTFKDRLETQVKVDLLHAKLSTEFPKATKGDIEEAVKQTIGEDQVPKQESEEMSGVRSAVEHHLSSEQFKHEVHDRLEQALDKKNEALDSISSNFAELLSFPTDDRCFIPVDNYTGTDSDINPLRKHLQDVFSSHFKDVNIPIQPSQLLLGIVLRKEYDIVSMDECIQIGRALNMGEEDVRFTVWFLDFLVGALIYHPDIEDDWFKDNIICSPQVVFDSISALIIESLMELHSPNACSKFSASERKNWKEKGQFSLDTVKRCHSEKHKAKVKEEKLIPVDKLVLLLEHSSLLAQITVKEKVGRKKTMCFVPAILECATPEQLIKFPSPDIDTPASVKITFEPQYVPIGVFCAMISQFVSKGREGILGMEWELVDSSVKRNLVTFRVDAAEHTVTLVAHVECIEVRLTRQDRSISVHDLGIYVLSTVLSVIKEINNLVCPIIAFDCPCDRHESRSSEKMCLLSHGVNPCFKCERRKVPLTPQQERWFSMEVKPGSNVQLKALQYAKEGDLKALTFKWYKRGSEIGTDNELKLEKVTDDCEGYYTCEVFKNGKPFFNMYHCLKMKGEAPLSANENLLGEAKQALKEIRADWYSLAVELGICHGTRKVIKEDFQLQGVEVCFNVMMQHWVSSTSPPPTKVALAKALTSPAISRADIASSNFPEVVADGKCESAIICDDEVLNVDKHLKIVRATTWDARAKWKALAVQLPNITGGDVKAIEKDYSDQGSCFTALLENWLIRSSPPPTAAALIEALSSPPVDRADIIKDLIKNSQ